MAAHEQSLVDRIYEAGLVPELWPDVIGRIALFGGCYGGSLFSVHGGGSLALATPDCQAHVEDLLQERWSRCNIRAERLIARRHPGFLTDRDVCSDEEIRTHPIYVDFLRPRGLGWTAATCIAGAPGDVAILSIDQLDERGPIPPATIELLDGLRPHIARAAMVSAQLQMERLRGWLHGLEALNVAAAAIDARGRVKASNRRFEDLAPKVATGAFDALSIADAGAGALFREALDGLKTGESRGSRSIPVSPDHGGAPLVLHVIPARRQGRDMFAAADAIVAAVPLAAPGLPFAALVHALYDLTPVEAITAEALLEGRSVREIAALRGIGVETVRTYVRNILAKTGTARQAELVARFSSLKATAPRVAEKP